MTERHTRQGQARGQDWGTLESGVADGTWTPENDRGVYPARDSRPPPDVLSRRLGSCTLGGCWCGQPMGHDWPGKTEGAPHPRGTWAERDGVETLERERPR